MTLQIVWLLTADGKSDRYTGPLHTIYPFVTKNITPDPACTFFFSEKSQKHFNYFGTWSDSFNIFSRQIQYFPGAKQHPPPLPSPNFNKLFLEERSTYCLRHFFNCFFFNSNIQYFRNLSNKLLMNCPHAGFSRLIRQNLKNWDLVSKDTAQ